jgi:hypothetical protein
MHGRTVGLHNAAHTWRSSRKQANSKAVVKQQVSRRGNGAILPERQRLVYLQVCIVYMCAGVSGGHTGLGWLLPVWYGKPLCERVSNSLIRPAGALHAPHACTHPRIHSSYHAH